MPGEFGAIKGPHHGLGSNFISVADDTDDLTPTDPLKYCPRCKWMSPLSAFPTNRSMRDGLATYCRDCSRAYERERYARSRASAAQEQRTCAEQKTGADFARAKSSSKRRDVCKVCTAKNKGWRRSSVVAPDPVSPVAPTPPPPKLTDAQRLETDPDFILPTKAIAIASTEVKTGRGRQRKYDVKGGKMLRSMTELEEHYGDFGAPDQVVAQALGMPVEEVEARYQSIVGKLRSAMGVEVK